MIDSDDNVVVLDKGDVISFFDHWKPTTSLFLAQRKLATYYEFQALRFKGLLSAILRAAALRFESDLLNWPLYQQIMGKGQTLPDLCQLADPDLGGLRGRNGSRRYSGQFQLVTLAAVFGDSRIRPVLDDDRARLVELFRVRVGNLQRDFVRGNRAGTAVKNM